MLTPEQLLKLFICQQRSIVRSIDGSTGLKTNLFSNPPPQKQKKRGEYKFKTNKYHLDKRALPSQTHVGTKAASTGFLIRRDAFILFCHKGAYFLFIF